MINLADFYTPTNPLFIKTRTLKLEDIVKLHSAVIMYKAHNKMLPEFMQELFKPRESRYALRGTAIFQKTRVRTNAKARCISVIGVNLWNSLDKDLKRSNYSKTFKKIYKDKIIDNYIAIN